jgi:hypothetical protein
MCADIYIYMVAYTHVFWSKIQRHSNFAETVYKYMCIPTTQTSINTHTTYTHAQVILRKRKEMERMRDEAERMFAAKKKDEIERKVGRASVSALYVCMNVCMYVCDPMQLKLFKSSFCICTYACVSVCM